MSAIVIDAGIVLRYFVGGSNATEAVALVNDYLRHGDTFIAPKLIVYEVASVLHKEFVRAGTLTVADVSRILTDLIMLVVFHDDIALWVRGVEIAHLTNQLNAYDAQYLALAERDDTLFWAVDKTFYDDAHTQFPQIRWLAHFSTASTSQ